MPSATIQLSDFAWTALSKEAERQGVSLEEILAHAAMYFLADLDSGRVATRINDAAQAADPEDEPASES